MTAIVLISVLAIHSSPGAEDRALLAHYTFEEGQGNKLKDHGGNGINGTICNAEWVKDGDGHALKFGRSDSYVDFGNDSRLRLTGDVTIAAWVRLTASPYPDPETNWTILTSEDHDGKPMPQSGFILRIAGDSSQLYFRSSQAGVCQNSTLAWPLENNRPYLVGIVKRGGAARFFLNGLSGSEFPVKDPAPGSTPLVMGGAGQSFNGIISDLRIYNRALSEDELKALYQRTAEGRATGDASTKPGPDANLALSANGGWVIPSSNANWTDLYAGNLIDGNPATAWQSFQPTKEEWVELKWDFEMAVSRIAVLERADSRVSEMELLAWVRDKWKSIEKKELHRRDSSGEWVEFQFPTLRARRLRLVCRNDEPRRTALREIQAFGPTQPLLYVDNGGDWRTGKWTCFPMSRREQVATYYRARSVGKQASLYEGAAESVVIEDAILEPKNPKPGQDVRLMLKMRPVEKLSDDYVLVATIGEREQLFQFSDYTVARAILTPGVPLSQLAAGETQTVEAKIYLPVWAPDGASDVMLHAISPADHPPLKFVDKQDRELNDGIAAVVDIRRFAKPLKPDTQPHTVKIDTSNGTIISLNGRRIVPTIFPLTAPTFEQFHYYSHGDGVKIFGLPIYPWAIGAGAYQQRNFDYLALHARNVMRVAPQDYLLIFVDLRTRPDWRAAHPDGLIMTHDGKRMAAESFCAKEYRDEAQSYVSNLVKFVQGQPWGNRVIGYNLCTGAEGIMGDYGMSSRSGIGDYNPQAIEAFREFARKRYGNDIERLRAAYNDPQLTFETIYPKHEKIMEPGADNGCFLDPRTQRLTSDYYEFLSSLVPTFTEELAATVKHLTGCRALVGTYGAYLLESIGVSPDLHQANHCYTHYLLHAPDLDFFASPHNYLDFVRQAGGPYRPYQPYAAMRLNGKLHISECDIRTFRCGMKNGYTHRSREETISVLTRDLGTGLMHGMAGWLADWSEKEYKDRSMWEPFFVDDQILSHIALLRRRYEETLDLKRGLDAEVAVFLSGPAAWYMDNGLENNAHAATNCLTQLINSLMKSGVPYHELTLEDIVKPEVQSGYKCCIFLNSFFMTAPQVRAVEKLKRDGKTLVWLYAPGYVRESGLSAKNIEEVTGFRVGMDRTQWKLAYRLVDRKHPVTVGLEDKEYLGDPRTVAPRFYVTAPGATVLGAYSDGKAAVVSRDFGTHKSIYSCVPHLPAPMLRNLLRYAGCHIYVADEIYMDATRNFLLLANSFDRKRKLTVNLPAKRDVFDLFSGKLAAKDADRFDAEIAPGETLLYRLK
ncbi:MAG: discoidin domain-containing protein [Verrucomicrobia bacterium]|nr:discoidin domain-containing protein [Verrucomicrobiota bacterium]